MSKVPCNIIKSFPFSEDGSTIQQAEKGKVVNIPAGLVNGLKDAGYLEPSDSKAAPKADDNVGEDPSSVEIPEGWRDLPWPALNSLASKVSPTPVKGKDSAVAAVEAELKRRADAAATNA